MVLLDTNVVSEPRNARAGRADLGGAAWAEGVEAGALLLSAVTIHEIELGMLPADRRDARQRAVLRAWMSQALPPAFEGRVRPVDGGGPARRCTFSILGRSRTGSSPPPPARMAWES